MSSEDNNRKAGVFDYIMLMAGAIIVFFGSKLLLGGSLSFVQENFEGPGESLPGLFVLLLGFVAFYFSLIKIISSKKNDT